MAHSAETNKHAKQLKLRLAILLLDLVEVQA
jgi:hypothetical protein